MISEKFTGGNVPSLYPHIVGEEEEISSVPYTIPYPPITGRRVKIRERTQEQPEIEDRKPEPTRATAEVVGTAVTGFTAEVVEAEIVE